VPPCITAVVTLALSTAAPTTDIVDFVDAISPPLAQTRTKTSRHR
jgi:hypothetical protein